jgi:hypothetical protein
MLPVLATQCSHLRKTGAAGLWVSDDYYPITQLMIMHLPALMQAGRLLTRTHHAPEADDVPA